MTLEEYCEEAILTYAPYYKQLNAIKTGEYAEFIEVVITLYKNHYNNLKETNSTWSELPQAELDWINTNLPYTL